MPMTDDDLEARLRGALRPTEPEVGFAARVATRMARERAPRPRAALRFLWVPAALAATVVVAMMVAHQRELRVEREGLAARHQLIEALRVTSAKLDLAYRGVNEAAQRPAAHDSGA
jgi:hypothetical protein